MLIITVLAVSGGNVSFGYVNFNNQLNCEKALEKLKAQDDNNPNYKFEMICVEG